MENLEGKYIILKAIENWKCDKEDIAKCVSTKYDHDSESKDILLTREYIYLSVKLLFQHLPDSWFIDIGNYTFTMGLDDVSIDLQYSDYDIGLHFHNGMVTLYISRYPNRSYSEMYVTIAPSYDRFIEILYSIICGIYAKIKHELK